MPENQMLQNPTIEPPRPLNLGEILDRTVQIYRRRFLVYMGIALIPTGALILFFAGFFLVLSLLGVSIFSAQGAANPALTGVLAVVLMGTMGLLFLPGALAITSLCSAALNHAVAHSLVEEKPTIVGSFKEAWSRGWQYIWLYFMQGVFVWGAPIVAWFVVVFSSAFLAALGKSSGLNSSAGGALLALALVLIVAVLLAYVIWMALRLSLCFPACVVEKSSAWSAIKRSVKLSKGTRGRIFVLYLLGVAAGWALSMVFTTVFIIVVALIPGINDPQRAQAAGVVFAFVIYGGSFLVQALTKPVYGIALMLFYYDQRIRQEGFDIEWMMQRAGLEVPFQQPPQPAPWLPPVAPTLQAAAPSVDAPNPAPVPPETAPQLPPETFQPPQPPPADETTPQIGEPA